MNDAQDNPYLNKELREGEGEGETVVSCEFSESPWNLRVCFPKTKFKSTLPTGVNDECRHLRFLSKAQKTIIMKVKHRIALQRGAITLDMVLSLVWWPTYEVTLLT